MIWLNWNDWVTKNKVKFSVDHKRRIITLFAKYPEGIRFRVSGNWTLEWKGN